jgi:hypothetical protein
MPYYITDKNPECSGWAVVDDGDGYYGCHTTKQSAIDQAVAISLATDEEFVGERSEDRAINEDAPAYMRVAARRGLEYYSEGLGGDGLVERTIREAREMANGNVSDDKWIRIAAWIARHLGDLDSPDANPSSDNYPSAGVVAHLLWGSGPSKRAAQRTLAYAESVVARIRADEESQRMNTNRALPDELAVGDTVAWVIQNTEIESYAGIVSELMETDAHVAVWCQEDGVWYPEGLTAVVPIADLKKINPLVSEPEMEEPMQDPSMPAGIPDVPFQVQSRDKWIRAAWAIKAKLEGASD